MNIQTNKKKTIFAEPNYLLEIFIHEDLAINKLFSFLFFLLFILVLTGQSLQYWLIQKLMEDQINQKLNMES